PKDTLAVGESMTCTATINVTADRTNIAVADGTSPEGNHVDDSDDAVVVIKLLHVDIAEPICDGNIPFLHYKISLDNVEGNPTVNITWLNPGGPNVVYADQPLEGQVLWPGAIPADQPGGPDWPGWSLVNGVWVQGDEFDWVRPTVQVNFEVNPQATVTVAYPE